MIKDIKPLLTWFSLLSNDNKALVLMAVRDFSTYLYDSDPEDYNEVDICIKNYLNQLERRSTTAIRGVK